jgi:hypothetical protein
MRKGGRQRTKAGVGQTSNISKKRHIRRQQEEGKSGK